jgi:hypothetical protein
VASIVVFKNQYVSLTPISDSALSGLALTETWTPVAASISFTSSSKKSRGGFGHFGDLFGSKRVRGGSGLDGDELFRTNSFDTEIQTDVVFKNASNASTPISYTAVSTRSLTDAWTPVASSISFTSSSKTSRGGFGHVADIFGSHLVRGGAGFDGSLLFRGNTLKVNPTFNQTQTGVVNIVLIDNPIQTGRVNILNTSAHTRQGVVNILGTSTRTQPGVVNIAKTVTKTQPGIVHVLGTTRKTQAGVVNILNTTKRTQPGKVDILGTTTKTQSGVVLIVFQRDQTQTGVVNIQPGTDRTQTGVVNIAADTTPPTPPGSLAASVLGPTVSLTWDPSTDDVAVVTYFVERCSGTGCSSGFTVIDTVPAPFTGYSDNPGPGDFCYRVRSQDAAGNFSAYSSTTCVTGVEITQRTQTGVVAIQDPTPSLGVHITQLPLMVAKHPTAAINVTQATLLVSKHPANEVHVSQVVFLVAVPYLGSYNYAHGGQGGWAH